MFAQTTTHETLLARLTSGEDRRAWDEFCARYGDLIRGFARRRGLQAADCDDVMQDVLLKLTRAMPGFVYDPARGKFRSYLKTVVLRVIIDRSSQKRGGSRVEDIEGAVERAAVDDLVERAWETEWRRYHLRRAMRQVEMEVSVKDFRAFQYYALEGGEAKVVAEALAISVDQVYQAKSQIVRRLGALIEAQVSEEG